jgi:DNA-binding transcriptional LysR family regulator
MVRAGDAGTTQNGGVPVGPRVLGRLGALDLGQVLAFVRVAEVGSISAAASGLGYSQPGLSQRVQLMERALGCQLFRRGSRGVALTPTGVLALPYARIVLNVTQTMAVEITRAQHRSGTR